MFVSLRLLGTQQCHQVIQALQHLPNHWALHGQQGAALIHQPLVALRCLRGHAQLCQAVRQGGQAHALQQRPCHILVLKLGRKELAAAFAALFPPL